MGRPKSLKPVEITRLLEDRKTMHYRALADKYGISRSSAWRYVQKYGKQSQHVIQAGLGSSDNLTMEQVFAKMEFPPSTHFSSFPDVTSQSVTPQDPPKRRHTQDFYSV